MGMTAQITQTRHRNIPYRPEFATRSVISNAVNESKGSNAGAMDTLNSNTFDATVRTYSADLFRFAFWLCRNRWQAQDLVQDTFVAAWKGRESLREQSATKAWLFSILRNEHTRLYQKKRLDLSDIELSDIEVAGNCDELERVDLEESLSALPRHFREPLMLQVLGGFSGKEIAAMLNISEPNVMTRLKRARDALQALAGSQGATSATTCG